MAERTIVSFGCFGQMAQGIMWLLWRLLFVLVALNVGVWIGGLLT